MTLQKEKKNDFSMNILLFKEKNGFSYSQDPGEPIGIIFIHSRKGYKHIFLQKKCNSGINRHFDHEIGSKT